MSSPVYECRNEKCAAWIARGVVIAGAGVWNDHGLTRCSRCGSYAREHTGHNRRAMIFVSVTTGAAIFASVLGFVGMVGGAVFGWIVGAMAEPKPRLL